MLSVQELMQKGTLLLASSGKEFIKPTGILSSSSEVRKARQEAMGRLGLDFLDGFGDGDDMDLEKELVADVETDTDMHVENGNAMDEGASPISPVSPVAECNSKPQKDISPPPRSLSTTPAAPSPSASAVPTSEENLAQLSARERNRLKRKRKQGNNAFVAPPAQHTGAKFQAASSGPFKKYVVVVLIVVAALFGTIRRRSFNICIRLSELAW